MTKNIPLRVPEEVHRVARVKIAQLDTSFQTVLLELLREWACGKREVVIADPQKDRWDRWHDMLADILESEDRGAIVAVQENLKTFHRLVQGGGGKELQADEARLLEEYRGGSFEKRKRMLAFVAKDEDAGPEMMPGGGRNPKGEVGARRRAGGK